MKKRVLALILGTMLVLSLAACGGSDDAAEADTTATEEAADTEEDTEDVEEATDETAEDTEFAEGDDGPLWSIDMMTEPVDVADTTWSFTGGCVDGEELTDEEIAASLEQYGGKLEFI